MFEEGLLLSFICGTLFFLMLWQAYTVELEAELNQLKEENAQLKQALAELERRRKQQCFEEVNFRVQTKAQKAKEKLRALRRNTSCPL